MAKITQTPLLVTFPPENLNPKTKTFFSMLTRRLAESVEGLNSSLAAGDLWPKKGHFLKVNLLCFQILQISSLFVLFD